MQLLLLTPFSLFLAAQAAAAAVVAGGGESLPS
jgi:hypothetical protein